MLTACVTLFNKSADFDRGNKEWLFRSLLNHVETKMTGPVKYHNFRAFYPFYLSEHSNRTSRRLHFIGSTIAIVLTIGALAAENGWLLLLALIQAYAFAWVGHFFYERNRPATFQHPFNSFMGDWRMWWDILTGKIPF